MIEIIKVYQAVQVAFIIEVVGIIFALGLLLGVFLTFLASLNK